MEIVSDARHFKTLNSILPEGMPQSSTIAVAGSPGAGKTIFASQLMFESLPSFTPIWFSTFSEPQNLLISHLSGFEFFDADKIGHPAQYIDLAAVFNQDQKFESVLEFIENETLKYKADVVIIDSFRQILEWAEFSKEGFRLIQNMPLYFAMRGITTFLLGEYDEQDIHDEVDFFGMVDGIIRITNEKEKFNRNRYIEILKMRGVPFRSGMHPVRIDKKGFHIYAQQPPKAIEESTTERMSTGIEGVDNMLKGGILKKSFLMVGGASGTGKTTFGFHFLNEGIKNREKVLYYSTEEERPQVLRNAASIGFDFVQAEKDELLTIASPNYADTSVEEVLSEIQTIAQEKKITRLLLDSLTSLARYQPEERVNHFTQSLRAFAKEQGVTLMTTSETADITSGKSQDEVRISSLTDVVISLRYVESDARMRRAIMVLKNRGGDHDKSLREYRISNEGLRVGQTFSGIEGILSGDTHKVGASVGDKIHEALRDVFGPLAETTYKDLSQLGFKATAISDYFADLVKKGVLTEEDGAAISKRIDSILNT